MATIDFFITKVSYDIDDVISEVEIRLHLYPITREAKIGPSRFVGREFIYDLLKTGKINIYTATLKNDLWTQGDKVGLYGDKYITTDGNKRTRDNLGNLPEF